MSPGSSQSKGFSLVVGGPFHALLRSLRLVGEDLLPTGWAALGLALVAWLPLTVIALVQPMLDGQYSASGYLADFTVHTRYLFAIWIMVMTERYADDRIYLLTRQFYESGLLSDESQARFKALLEKADRLSASYIAEGVILLLAIIWSTFTALHSVEVSLVNWDGAVVMGEPVLSPAGEFARFVSNPLFLFLVIRWFWRFLVWTLLLFRISRLKLQLTPLHPDRTGGLGFLSIYPSIFSGFVFALSSVVAASLVKEMQLVSHAPEQVWFFLAGWLLVIFILFIAPLLVFTGPLYYTRERALIEYGRLATMHNIAFHRKWISKEPDYDELLGSPDPSALADINAAIENAQRLRYIPLDMRATIQLLLAAGIPLLAVVATQIPLVDLAKWFVGTIF